MNVPMNVPIVELVMHGALDHTPIKFTYTNYKGESSERRARFKALWFGTSWWHKEPQWFVHAEDLDKGERRDFALRDMKDVRWDKE
jgi:hypothetical protein